MKASTPRRAAPRAHRRRPRARRPRAHETMVSVKTVARWAAKDLAALAARERRPQLLTIPFSHYCENAAWALDRARVDYREHTKAVCYPMGAGCAEREGDCSAIDFGFDVPAGESR